jgi:hypothetical protein
VKIQIGKTTTKLSLVQNIRNAGLAFGRNDAGDEVLTIKFPGCDAIELSRDGMESLNQTLTADTPEGDAPEAVFARTATTKADGSLSAQFSDAKRSRSVSFTATDREEVAALLAGHLDAWAGYSAELADAEDGASDKTNSGE